MTSSSRTVQQTDTILQSIRVIELARDIAGPAAGLQLSEAGAQVIRIEPPGGDAQQDDVLFSVLNRGKQRRALDIDSAAGRATLQELLEGADVFLHDFTPQQAAARGLDDAALSRSCPRLVIAAITGWPQAHPLAEVPPCDTLVLARLGLLDEQPGHRRGPVFVRMPFASWMAGWFCVIGVMARLIARARDGCGGVARTSLAQAALAPMCMHWSRAEKPTPVFAKGLDKNTPIPLHECADGRWLHVHYSPDKAPWMAQALTAMGPATIAAENAKYPPSHVAPNFGANKAIIATRAAREWVEHFWQHDVAAQIAVPFGEIYRDAQARLNGYVVAVDDACRGLVLQPGPSYLTDPPPRVRGPLAPLVSHVPPDTAVPSAIQPRSVAADRAATDTAQAPLAGLKVLDLGAYLAGPFAAMLLADLGADVIKVEPPTGDPMRRLERIFAGTQRGKRGVALKLGEPGSHDALAALARWADVVHHNIRLPAARKLGVDYDALKAINPALVVCHISSYGPNGPRKDWPGFDQLMQAACGWEVESGGAGNPPMWLRFGMGDYFAALSSVFALLLAHYQRLHTGKGQMVASSLLGATLLTAAEAVMFSDGRISDIAHLDADQTGLSPDHRLYRCRDGWIALAALQTSQAQALANLAGTERARWFAALSCTEALARLQQAGVPAEPVMQGQGEAFHDDAGHAAAGLHAQYPHAVYGRLEQVGAFWDFGDLPLTLVRAPPTLGEHSREVWQQLGLDAEQIARLQELGLTNA